MYFRRLWNLILIGVLTGCATFAPPRAEDCRLIGIICPEDARVERVTLQKLLDLPVPKQKAVIAVYSFDDLTGQQGPEHQQKIQVKRPESRKEIAPIMNTFRVQA